MVYLKHSNLDIFLRKYAKFKSENFRCYYANSPLTIELVHELSNNPRICCSLNVGRVNMMSHFDR